MAKKVYTHATKNLKRVLALGGAKNVLIIVPDASVEATVRDVSASVTGMAGQRCMAASVAVLVGDASSIFKNRLEEAFKKLNEGNTLPPLISESASTHIEAYLDEAVAKGAKLLVDGRSVRREKGYYIGASILDWTGLEHLMPQEEVFGPVLELLSAETLEDALILQHTSPYGNACSVFTQSGRIAERVENEAHAGMIGVNVGIPVPREPFSFAGIGDSKFGFGEITGELSLEFWSNLIKVTQKWHESEPTNWMD